jgi:hypothetical protein
MRIRQSLIGCAAALVLSMSASYAGPCSQEIDRLQAELELNVTSATATPMPAEAPVTSARLLPNFRFIETLSVGHHRTELGH